MHLALFAAAAAMLHAGKAPIALPAAASRAVTPRMLFGRPPPEIMRLSNPDWRYKEKPFSDRELIAIWNAFERVYGSREKALAASRKNQQVILPYVNTPETIIGAHAALIKLLGKERTAIVIEKNPGVLACDPVTLAKTSPADIEGAANSVAWFDSLPEDLRAGIPILTWFALVGTIGGRVIACGSKVCGSADEWDLQGGLGPQLLRFVDAALQGAGAS